VACAIAFVASYLFGRGIDQVTLICCGAKDRELIVGAGEWWRLLSAGFLHAHFLHLAVNLYALIILGPLVEQLWGTRRFLIIYIAALVGGNLASLVATPGVSVGASGAIFGLFGAVAVFSTVYRRFVRPEARVRLWLNLTFVAAANVVLGILIPAIDNAAHAGGFATGALAALFLRPFPTRRAPNPAAELMVRLTSLAATAAVIWALLTAIDFARSSDWILLARTAMEPRVLAGGRLTLLVPRGWDYEAPEKEGGPHVFFRRGLAQIGVREVPPKEGIDAEPVARGIQAVSTKARAKLLTKRDISVGDHAGVEMLFRQRVRGESQARREVVFPAGDERLVHVSCVCAERRYRLLEVIFDNVLQSIKPTRLPRPAETAGQRVWQRYIDNPRDPEACVALAALYSQEGRHGAAEQVLRRAIGERPDHADAHEQLAYLYAKAPPPYRRPQDAIRHARKALEIEPDSPRYLGTLALAYEAAGQKEEALEAAKRAAALAPDDAHYADLVKRLSR